MSSILLQGRNAVICDDDGLQVCCLKMALRHMGAGEITAVDTAEEAVEAARARKPHIVFLNIDLPSVRGIEAIRRIKALGAACLIAILTLGNRATNGSAIDAGADGCLIKPYFSDDIFEVVQKADGFRPAVVFATCASTVEKESSVRHCQA